MKWTIIFNFMQNKCIKKGDDRYLCIRNYTCCDRKKITQLFLLWMGNWGLEIWFTRDFFFSLLHTQRRVASFLPPVQILIFLHLFQICELHLSSDSHVYKTAIHRTAANRNCQVWGRHLTYELWVCIFSASPSSPFACSSLSLSDISSENYYWKLGCYVVKVLKSYSGY